MNLQQQPCLAWLHSFIPARRIFPAIPPDFKLFLVVVLRIGAKYTFADAFCQVDFAIICSYSTATPICQVTLIK